MARRADPPDRVGAHHERPVDAHETEGGQPVGERSECRAEAHALAAAVDLDLVVARTDPDDVVEADRQQPSPAAHEDSPRRAFGPLALSGAPADLGEQRRAPVRGVPSGQPGERALEVGRVEGAREIGRGARLEGEQGLCRTRSDREQSPPLQAVAARESLAPTRAQRVEIDHRRPPAPVAFELLQGAGGGDDARAGTAQDRLELAARRQQSQARQSFQLGCPVGHRRSPSGRLAAIRSIGSPVLPGRARSRQGR